MVSDDALGAIERLSHTRLSDCYQCGKCSAGCPVASQMDALPNQLIRWLQLGRADRAMRSEAIWQCVSCMTCSARCPKSVDCAAVMDALRQVSAESGVAAPARRRTLIFQRAFLDNIRRNGRLTELELVGIFKTKAFLNELHLPFLWKDALLAPRLLKRGKFHFLGEKVKDRGVVRRIFERCNGHAASESPSP